MTTSPLVTYEVDEQYGYVIRSVNGVPITFKRRIERTLKQNKSNADRILDRHR